MHVLKSDEQPSTFKCARKRCNACPFIHNVDKKTGPKRPIKINDRFTWTSANVMYCITRTLCKKGIHWRTGRRLGDRFREHLRDVKRNDKDASKPVARHFNLPNHSSEHMRICAFPYTRLTRKAVKIKEKNSFFKSAHLIPTVSTNAFHSTNLFLKL